jgi:hypothetical protein
MNVHRRAGLYTQFKCMPKPIVAKLSVGASNTVKSLHAIIKHQDPRGWKSEQTSRMRLCTPSPEHQ